jgi:hypothetical protein
MTKELTFFQHVLRLPLWPFRHWFISLFLFMTLLIAMIAYLKVQQKSHQEVFETAEIATTFDELNLARFAPEDNAAPIYSEIANWTIHTDVSGEVFNGIQKRFENDLREQYQSGYSIELDEYSMPLSDEELGLIDTFMEDHANRYERFKSALELPGCQFGHYDTGDLSKAPDLPTEALGTVRQLARLASLRSLWAFSQGDLKEAIFWNAAGLKVANQLANDPLLIVGLVRAAVADLMIEDLPILLSTNETDPKMWKPIVEQLIPLADRRASSVFVQGEVCFMIGNTNALQGGRNFLSKMLFVGPLKAYTATVMIPLIESMNDDQTWHYEYYEKVGAELENEKRSWFPGTALAQSVGPPFIRGMYAFDRQHVRAQQAIIGVALNKYKNENGNFPDQLDALAPKFLELLPLDPFSNQSYVYETQDNGYTLYSFGTDGGDDGGQAGVQEGDMVWIVK